MNIEKLFSSNNYTTWSVWISHLLKREKLQNLKFNLHSKDDKIYSKSTTSHLNKSLA